MIAKEYSRVWWLCVVAWIGLV